jgi:hypothetical protein
MFVADDFGDDRTNDDWTATNGHTRGLGVAIRVIRGQEDT